MILLHDAQRPTTTSLAKTCLKSGTGTNSATNYGRCTKGIPVQ